MESRPIKQHGGIAASLVLLALAPSVHASNHDSESEPEEGSSSAQPPVIEEIITVGSRLHTHTLRDSPVPVDIYSEEEIASVNSSDLIEVLTSIIPSFSVRRQPISDGASFVRPTHMRNLEQHHTLVLINNKRRHRSAFMLPGGYGSHGSDIGNIPSVAIDYVEVLRDGAGAHYGSDAIAGAISFNLREDDSGSLVRTKIGEYGAGDGREFTVEAYTGQKLFDDGFINISGQFSDSNSTSRSQAYNISIAGTGILPSQAVDDSLTVDGITYYGPDAFTYQYADDGQIVQVLPGADGIPDDRDTRYRDNFSNIGGSRSFKEPEQIWGQPERRQYLLVVNAGVPLENDSELYAFGNYSHKDQTGGFFYRRPGISTFRPLRLQDGSIYDPRQTLYPAGFTPQFSADVTDVAGILGFRGSLGESTDFDVSISYGNNTIEY